VNAKQKNQFKPSVEGLEQRALLTGLAPYTSSLFSNGVLVVQAQKGAGALNLAESGGQITIDGVAKASAAKVSYIMVVDWYGGHTITAGASLGNTRVWIDSSNATVGDTINLNNNTAFDWVRAEKNDVINVSGDDPTIFSHGATVNHV
jgi:hypothetical protein